MSSPTYKKKKNISFCLIIRFKIQPASRPACGNLLNQRDSIVDFSNP